MPPKSPHKEKVVALKYKIHEDEAPRVIAKGQGEVARRILEIAKDNNIEIQEDADLAEILYALELDEFIPIEAYQAVADIMKFIYNKKR